MSGESLQSLIANLNSESPVISSPEDYSAELLLWTNAEFTFDMPPGMGIFEHDSGFESMSSMNHAGLAAMPEMNSTLNGTALAKSSNVVQNPQSALDQQHLMDYLNLPQEESRPLSLLERTRQRNPAQAEQDPNMPELQEQAAAINAFHSLLAAYSASNAQPAQQQPYQRPTQSGLPMLLPNVATVAPTTPAAAKLLRQPLPQYKAPAAKKQKTLPVPVVVPTVASPVQSPVSASAIAVAAAATSSKHTMEDQDMDADEPLHEVSAADLFNKDDPDYLTSVAAEEDKRRRNTAASARFRYKKKLREQALEQTAKEQTTRAEALEARVKELEMEVKWLRGLIVEKDSRLHEVSIGLDSLSNKRMKLDLH